MKKSLLNCCDQLFFIYKKIEESNVENASDIFNEIKEGFSDFSRQAKEQAFDSIDIQLASYALVSLIDESINMHCPDKRKDWPVQSLQLHYYKSNVAGDEFFDKLNGLLNSSALNYSVLAVYYFCLQLNFKGKYYYQQEVLTQYQEKLKEIFYLKPEIHPKENLKNKKVPLWILIIVLLSLALIIYLTFVFFMNESLFVVTTDINTTVEQLQHVENS